jgi:hypothetical protein
MFGFRSKRDKAVEQAELYLRSIFAGLAGPQGEPLPVRTFADPYVVGFLEVLTTHAVATVYRFRMPDAAALTAIMAEALDRMAFGYGGAARSAVIQHGSPTGELHHQYLRGREDGVEHVRTLFTHDGIARNGPHRMFRDYVKRHYL